MYVYIHVCLFHTIPVANCFRFEVQEEREDVNCFRFEVQEERQDVGLRNLEGTEME